MFSLVWFLIVGLLAGLLARALVPGEDAMGLLATLVLGLAGSLVGGLPLGVLTVGLRSGAWAPPGSSVRSSAR